LVHVFCNGLQQIHASASGGPQPTNKHMQKILVTGASGFVGAALCERLARDAVPFLAAARKGGAADQFECGDIDGATDWSAALAGCAAVIHLAARVHVMDEAHDAEGAEAAYRAVNLDATVNLARQAAAGGVRRFVYVSSVKVNGEASARPFTAHDAPAPRDPYARSKLAAERALLALAGETGMQVAIVRPPLVYGPGVGANFRRLMQLVKLGLPLPLGALDNRRSLVALDNLVDLLLVCARHPDAAGEVFLVSDDDDVSTAELLRRLGGAMGRRARLWPLPASCLAGAAALLGKSNQAERLLGSLQVDIGHTRRVLGWRPPVGMRQALAITAADFLRRADRQR
jgi:nucleoside-diphosphate-sugar epimerase